VGQRKMQSTAERGKWVRVQPTVPKQPISLQSPHSMKASEGGGVAADDDMRVGMGGGQEEEGQGRQEGRGGNCGKGVIGSIVAAVRRSLTPPRILGPKP
jgi:hypothetical protein